MKLNRRGLIATIIYHALLLLLLVFAGLTFPDPPPEEEGILVNFGTDEFGLGDFEPMGDDQQAGNPDEEITQAREPVEAGGRICGTGAGSKRSLYPTRSGGSGPDPGCGRDQGKRKTQAHG